MSNPDKLDFLKVKSEEVLVGDRTLTLRTSTIMQQRDLVVALAKIDPAPLFAAARPIVDSAGGDGFVAAVIAAGPALYQTLMQFLGTAGGEVLAQAAAAALDNEANFRTLREEEKVVADEDRAMEGRRYVSCDALRSWVCGTITPRQAFHVLATTIRLNDYGVLGEALAGLAKRAAGTATKASPTPSPTLSARLATASSDETPAGVQA